MKDTHLNFPCDRKQKIQSACEYIFNAICFENASFRKRKQKLYQIGF